MTTAFDLIVHSAAQAYSAWAKYNKAWTQVAPYSKALTDAKQKLVEIEEEIAKLDQLKLDIENSIESDSTLISNFINNFPQSNPQATEFTFSKLLCDAALKSDNDVQLFFLSSEQVSGFINEINSISQKYKISDANKTLFIKTLNQVMKDLSNRKSLHFMQEDKRKSLQDTLEESNRAFKLASEDYVKACKSVNVDSIEDDLKQKEKKCHEILTKATKLDYLDAGDYLPKLIEDTIKHFEDGKFTINSNYELDTMKFSEKHFKEFRYPFVDYLPYQLGLSFPIDDVINETKISPAPVAQNSNPNQKIISEKTPLISNSNHFSDLEQNNNRINTSDEESLNYGCDNFSEALIATIRSLYQLDWSHYTRVGKKPDGLMQILNAILRPGKRSVLEAVQSVAESKYSAHFQWAHSFFRGRKEKTNDVYKILCQMNIKEPASLMQANTALEKLKAQIEAENYKREMKIHKVNLW